VEATPCTDNDMDGVFSDVDCDDNDPNSFPGNTEVCDGADNDCNNIVDDGIPAVPTQCGVGECADVGAITCVNGAEVNSCQPGASVAEICDSLDNDCDGSIDEGNPGGGATCSAGIGECSADGTIQCSSGTLSCNAVVGSPTAEICDSLDNDCDGSIDEGNPEGGAACSAGTGECSADGTIQCSGGALECDAVAGSPTTEICDGLDNDCNEAVDEDLGTLSCGVGACAVTVEACFEANTGVCTPLAPTAEVCDGIDNNCDGMVDEGGVCAGPMTIDIKPGSDPSSVSCKNNKGSVPVAVFGSANFDVSTIDLGSLELNGIPVTEKHDTRHIEDKNGDEFPDAVLHLEKAGVCEATSDNNEYPLKKSRDVTLTGSNGDGDFEAIGDIRIVKR